PDARSPDPIPGSRFATGSPLPVPAHRNVTDATHLWSPRFANVWRMTARSHLVLLVEDFEDAREMYTEFLEYSGLRVAGASDAVQGLKMAEELQPSIILMDAALPGLSGWDAIKQLKANPATKHIPVLMLTGHVLGDARDRAMAAGADGFIPKPCLPDELAERIFTQIRKGFHANGEPC
ncbi:MAG: response regulator, partial [Vicinamibacterales bacterium]